MLGIFSDYYDCWIRLLAACQPKLGMCSKNKTLQDLSHFSNACRRFWPFLVNLDLCLLQISAKKRVKYEILTNLSNYLETFDWFKSLYPCYEVLSRFPTKSPKILCVDHFSTTNESTIWPSTSLSRIIQNLHQTSLSFILTLTFSRTLTTTAISFSSHSPYGYWYTVYVYSYSKTNHSKHFEMKASLDSIVHFIICL